MQSICKQISSYSENQDSTHYLLLKTRRLSAATKIFSPLLASANKYIFLDLLAKIKCVS